MYRLNSCESSYNWGRAVAEPPDSAVKFYRGEMTVGYVDVDQVIEQYFGRIHRAALVLTGNPWDADDLVQETFLVLARSSHRFAGRSKIYTWLYGTLLNLERRHRRTHVTRRRKLRVLWDSETSDEPSVPAARVEVEEWKRGLWAQVARLSDGQRQTLVLRFSEQLSYQEIAEVLECPIGTIKSRIHHGLTALRTNLDSAAGEGSKEVPRNVNRVFPHAV